MKPLNLEVALNGAKVVTSDGAEVKQLTLFDCTTSTLYCLYGVVNGRLCNWHIDTNELFMAPVKKTGWVASTHFNDKDVCMCSRIFETKELAKEVFWDAEVYRFHEIEWEE